MLQRKYSWHLSWKLKNLTSTFLLISSYNTVCASEGAIIHSLVCGLSSRLCFEDILNYIITPSPLPPLPCIPLTFTHTRMGQFEVLWKTYNTIQYVNTYVVEHGRMFKIQYYGNKILLIQDILEHAKVLFGKS